MRLINTHTLVLEECFGDQIPKYAILSHTWRNEEVSYQDWQYNQRESATKKGFRKIHTACLVAQRHSIEYLWVDTNCINKDSSSELSEAINSMFTWYERASICFVYLDDFYFEPNGSLAGLEASRWFTRGWTLQELLCPTTVKFFDASWTEFGTKRSLKVEISNITSIDIQYLLDPDSIHRASVSRRMSWVATRSTTREEDMAYCLLGIFEINMPLLYGEGGKAFIRLQEEIIKHSNDHTIFCWSWAPSLESNETPDWHGCLAPRPIAFRDAKDFVPTEPTSGNSSDFQLTNSGLRITLPLLDGLLDQFKLGMLDATHPATPESRLCLCLQTVGGKSLARSRFPNRLLNIPRSWPEDMVSVYLAHERDPSRKFSTVVLRGSIGPFLQRHRFAILPVSAADSQGVALMSIYTMISIPPTQYGAVRSLSQGDEKKLWFTNIKMTSPERPIIEVNFKARIEKYRGGIWYATIKIQHEKKVITQDIALPPYYEFTLGGDTGPTFVRPVLISFSKLLAEDGGKTYSV
ncbi:hypothetical protein EG329_002195 [Mollisiaceae sp. DMI_Dod_QoI]|nr:hypothetical protein EG329_002195 [Helotiales sp. DMI_Dod_QoI]